MAALAMFPLGSVLFPSLMMPLHVFEPRYRVMIEGCLSGTREFGVVLIERGSEVGGGEVRSAVGTVAQIVDAARADDGRWAIAVTGTRRIRVIEWLPDDPFPQAVVEDWPEPEAAGDLQGVYGSVLSAFRRVAAMMTELGDEVAPATVDFSGEAVLGSYQLSALSPFGPLDQQRLLSVVDAGARLETLLAMLDDEAEFLARRLEMG